MEACNHQRIMRNRSGFSQEGQESDPKCIIPAARAHSHIQNPDPAVDLPGGILAISNQHASRLCLRAKTIS